MTSKYRLVIISLLITLIVALLGWKLFSSVPSGYARVQVRVFPSDAAITINNTAYKNNNYVNLKYGTYTITIKRDGFSSYDGSIIINNTSKIVAYLLDPVTVDAKQWLSQHQNEYNEVYSLSEKQDYDSSDAYVAKYPIVNKLPYIQKDYKIGSIVGSDPLIITITAESGSLNTAINTLNSLGYNPAEGTVRLNYYVNPFTNERSTVDEPMQGD